MKIIDKFIVFFERDESPVTGFLLFILSIALAVATALGYNPFF